MPVYTRNTPLGLRSIALLAVAIILAGTGVPAAAIASPLDTLSIALIWESNVSDDPTLVISARLPDDARLPAEMVLPVPENATILYAAEFFPEGDRENRPLQAEVEIREGVPVVVLTLTESRIGLVDVGYSGSRALVQALDNVYETGFELVLPADAQSVYAAIALPPSIEALESSEPISVSDEPDGNRYHSIERTGATAGDRIALTMQVRELADSEVVDEAVPWMVWAVVAIIIGAAVILMVSRRRSPTED